MEKLMGNNQVKTKPNKHFYERWTLDGYYCFHYLKIVLYCHDIIKTVSSSELLLRSEYCFSPFFDTYIHIKSIVWLIDSSRYVSPKYKIYPMKEVFRNGKSRELGKEKWPLHYDCTWFLHWFIRRCTQATYVDCWHWCLFISVPTCVHYRGEDLTLYNLQYISIRRVP